MRRVVAPVTVLVLVAAGCGGGDDGGSDEDPGEARPAAEQNAYDAARTVCGESSVGQVARELGVDASSPEEVAQAYAEEVSTPDFQNASRDGCLAGLEARE